MTNKSREESIARFISYLFHPLLMPSYGFLIVFFTKNYISLFTPINFKLYVLGVTFLFTFLLPLLNALILFKLGKIKSLSMNNASERSMPYLGAVIYYFALYYLLDHSEVIIPLFKALILGAAASVTLTFLINFKWKISAHMTGVGGVAGAVLGIFYRLQIDMLLILLVIIFVSGIIAYARLKLRAHSPTQVYTGFLVGFVVEFLLIISY